MVTKVGLGVVDPDVLDRANQAGVQSISTITGLAAALARFTDWVAYTPTFTAFGTVSEVNIFSRRFGDTLHIRGSFVSGTPVASEARMSLGFNGADGGLTIDPGKIPVLQTCGFATRNTNTVTQYYIVADTGSIGYLNFAYQSESSNSGAKANANSIISASGRLSIICEVPISGW